MSSLAPVGVLGEQLPEVPVPHLPVVLGQCLPLRAVADPHADSSCSLPSRPTLSQDTDSDDSGAFRTGRLRPALVTTDVSSVRRRTTSRSPFASSRQSLPQPLEATTTASSVTRYRRS